ncbi:unnamed protein product [Microthlaspi erraticum]|uniref:Uncharacterized protein n=1 Tax=Microthlaspi erraticum TaxID=1685480 RepID=A0A6D2J3W3_9BRAS|nr:unnamed protein product [Microthlaspi erraticum]
MNHYSTLYRGCLARYREMLDTASNGNFLNQDVDDGWQLVENMAISTECYGEHYELDKLILAQFPAKHVNYVSGKTLVKDRKGRRQHECIILFTTRVCPSSYTEKWDNFLAGVAHPKSLWTSMTRKGRIWSSMLTSCTNSIELEQNPEPELDRAEETETQQDKPELDRARKEQTKQVQPTN